MKRAQYSRILADLGKKIVFLAGPRQAGKTWLAKKIAEEFERPVYLNFDQLEDRAIIKTQSWLKSTDLVILDELHKMKNWKNYLKGLFDTKPEHLKILVTGSARLEIFRQVGDSLAGRYYLHHLLPLSPAELQQVHEPVDIDHLIQRSGFPEPYLASSETEAARWRMQYTDSLIRTDVLDFDNIHNLKAMQTVFELLRTKVGSPISYQSIAIDVGISPNTVRKYIAILEALYIIFKVSPYSRNIARSLLKEPKIYFFDIGLVKGDEGIKFENLVANCLLKHVYAKRDYAAEYYELKCIKTKEKKEVDFALVKEDSIIELIEVKHADPQPSKSLLDYAEKYAVPGVQIIKNIRQERRYKNVNVMQAESYLTSLML